MHVLLFTSHLNISLPSPDRVKPGDMYLAGSLTNGLAQRNFSLGSIQQTEGLYKSNGTHLLANAQETTGRVRECV